MNRKANITLKLDVDLLRSVKVAAAKRGTSINSFAAETLAAAVKHEESYEESMKRALALMKENSAFGWRKPKSRDELHER
jgi:plasmid stability protein